MKLSGMKQSLRIIPLLLMRLLRFQKTETRNDNCTFYHWSDMFWEKAGIHSEPINY